MKRENLEPSPAFQGILRTATDSASPTLNIHSLSEALRLIDSISIPDDIMFIAYCYHCQAIADFQFGRCLTCAYIWRPLTKHLNA